MPVELTSASGLWIGALALPLVLLYVLRSRRRRVPVGSTWLWRKAETDLQARRPFRRLARELPLLLELAGIAALSLAAADPRASGIEMRGHSTAIVVDVSASMAAKRPDGSSRLHEAVAEARRIVDALYPGTSAMIVTAGASPRVVTPFDTDRHRLRRGLATLGVLDEPGTLAPALELAAERLEALGGPGRIVVITDGSVDTTRIRHAPIDVRHIGAPVSNVGIVGARALPAATLDGSDRRVEIEAVIQSFSTVSEPRYVTLRRKDSPDPIASRRIELAPGTTESMTLSFDRAPSEVGVGLVLELSPEDALSTDDHAYLVVPPSRTLPVVLASRDGAPWIERALAADPEVDLSIASPGVEPPPGSLLVAHGYCPQWGHVGDLLVLEPPPGRCLGVEVGEEYAEASVTSWDAEDPRMRFANLDGLSVPRGRRLEHVTDEGALVRAGPEVLVARADGSGRHGTIVGFDVAPSAWPRTASFVVFVHNVAELARQTRTRALSQVSRSGRALELSVPSSAAHVELEAPGGERQSLPVFDGMAIAPPPRRTGLYFAHWQGPAAGSQLVAVSLLSASESNLEAAVAGAAPSAPTGLRAARWTRSAAWLLGALALALVLADAAWLARGRPRPRVGSVLRRPTFLALGLTALGIAGIAASELAGLSLSEQTPLHFERPWLALLAPALVVVTSVLVGAQASRWTRLRRGASEAIAGSAALAALCIAAELEAAVTMQRLAVLVAVDRSRSTDLVPDVDARVTAELRAAETSMREHDLLGRLAFGANAELEEPLRERRAGTLSPPQRVAIERDGTDLEAAISKALAGVPPDVSGRIVLLSDGVATRGDALAASAAARAAGVPVDIVPLDQRQVDNLRLRSVSAPATAALGEPLELRVVIDSPRRQDVELRLYRDGRLVHAGVATVDGGEDVAWLRDVADSGGLHRYDVEITAQDPSTDALAEDNRAASFVRVEGPARALVIAPDSAGSPPIAQALERVGLHVTVVGPVAIPGDVAAFATYDLVVLGSVPARALAPGQLEALATFVESAGGGLLLLGGPDALGPGGYGRTAVERVSPVSFDLKQDRRRGSLAEVIAIDSSGSMSARAGKHSKIELAGEAALRSIALLGEGDRVGVAHVDTAVSWTVPLGPPHLEAMTSAVKSVGAGGGGIYVDAALRAAYTALGRERATLRHVLLFSDGSDAEERTAAPALVAEAARRGVTTSVVALGSGTDVPGLEQLSRLGRGRFYLIEHAGRLPAVFAQETIAASRSAIVDKPFTPVGSPGAGFLRGVDMDDLPPLDGYVVTLLKARAEAPLRGPEADPLLAVWPVGLGRAAAFTSDYDSRWSRTWMAWPGASQLFAQLGRHLARAPDAHGVSVRARVDRGRLHVLATTSAPGAPDHLEAVVAGPDGIERRAPLVRSTGGAHQVDVDLSQAGSYVVAVVDGDTGRSLATTAVELSRAVELTPTGSNRKHLQRVAALSGGRVRATLAGVFDDRGDARRTREPLTPPLSWFSAVALLALVGVRKLVIPTALRRLPAALAGRLRAVAARRTPDAPVPDTTAALLRVKASRSLPRAAPPTAGSEEPPPSTAAVSVPRDGAAAAEAPPTPGDDRTRPDAAGLSSAEILARRKRRH
jgi:uncharacterized membrane protein